MAAVLIGYKYAIPYQGSFILRFIWLTGAITLGTAIFVVGTVTSGLVDRKLIYKSLDIKR